MVALPGLWELIYRYKQVNPCYCSISQVSRYFSENHPGQKLINLILQIEDYRFRRRKSHHTWWVYLPMSATTLDALFQKILTLVFILFIIVGFIYVLISQVPNLPSCAIITDLFTRHFTTINTYFYVLLKYLHTHKGGGVLGILIRIPFSFTQDSIE